MVAKLERRKVGGTGLEAGVIGFGTEYLFKKTFKRSEEEVVRIVKAAIKGGVNYFDLVFSIDDYAALLAEGFKGRRSDLILTAHLGSGEYRGGYKKTRSPKSCEKIFDKLLDTLGTDYIDLVNVHFIRDMDEYNKYTAPGQILDLALRLKEEGRARHVMMSTHDPRAGLAAARTGKVEAIMMPVNIANHNRPFRNEMLAECNERGVGVIAMKIFSRGTLLHPGKIQHFPNYAKADMSRKVKLPDTLTPIKCIAYSLSQPAVFTVVPGISTAEELEGCLAYATASKKDRNFKMELDAVNG